MARQVQHICFRLFRLAVPWWLNRDSVSTSQHADLPHCALLFASRQGQWRILPRLSRLKVCELEEDLDQERVLPSSSKWKALTCQGMFTSSNPGYMPLTFTRSHSALMKFSNSVCWIRTVASKTTKASIKSDCRARNCRRGSICRTLLPTSVNNQGYVRRSIL